MPLRVRISAEHRDSTAVLAAAMLGLCAGCGSPESNDKGWVTIVLERDVATIDDANRYHLKIRSATAVLFQTTAGMTVPVVLDAPEIPGANRTFEVVLLTSTDVITAVGDAGPVDLPEDRHTTVQIPLREP